MTNKEGAWRKKKKRRRRVEVYGIFGVLFIAKSTLPSLKSA